MSASPVGSPTSSAASRRHCAAFFRKKDLDCDSLAGPIGWAPALCSVGKGRGERKCAGPRGGSKTVQCAGAALNVASPGECGLYVLARIEVRLRMIDVDMPRQRVGNRLWTTATTKLGFGYSCSPLLQFGPWPGSSSSRREDFALNAPHRLDSRRPHRRRSFPPHHRQRRSCSKRRPIRLRTALRVARDPLGRGRSALRS
jgi:hypothetical protein